MTARVTGWAPDPHDAEPAEGAIPRCACCGREADYFGLLLTEEERRHLGLREGIREVDLCDKHDDQRRDSWGDALALHGYLEALAIAAGVESDRLNDHPELLTIRIAALLPHHPTHNPGGRQ